MLLNDLQRNEEMGRRSGRPTIAPDVRLGITIRILAGEAIWT